MIGPSSVKIRELEARMRRLKVGEEDLDEQFIRSSGRGGQNVNKVATCVYLIHRPTGLSVKCQAGRTQAANRHTARCLLLDKIESREEERRRAEIARREKARRRKRRRSAKSKEAMLEAKRRRSRKKQDRRRIDIQKDCD